VKSLAIVVLAACSLCLLPACNSNQQGAAPPDGMGNAAVAPAPAPQEDVVVASINGVSVTNSELQDALLQSYGLNLLAELAERDMARQDAADHHVAVSDEDIQAEEDRILIGYRNQLNANQPTTQPDQALSDDERKKLMASLAATQGLSLFELQVAIETNTILRKLVLPVAAQQLTEQNIRARFDMLYGEKVKVRWIRAESIIDIGQIENELKAGQTFEELQRLHAYDSEGRPSAGVTDPFGPKEPAYPPEFRQAAFDLKVGQISDPVQIQDQYFLLQLIDVIPPQHANYADYRDTVKQELFEETIATLITADKQRMAVQLQHDLEIQNPVLRRQYEDKMAELQGTLQAGQKLKAQFEEEPATTRPQDEP